MNVIEALNAAQGGRAIANLGQRFGLSPDDAEAVVRGVVGQLSSSIERNTLSRGGLADLIRALGQGQHEAALDDPRAFANRDVHDDGNRILDHIVGSKDASRGVADRVALSSGVSASIIKMMLPFIASMLMGGLSKMLKGGLGEIAGRTGAPAPRGRERGGSGGYGETMPELPRMPEGGGIGRGGGLTMPGQSSDDGSGTGSWPAPQPSAPSGRDYGNGGSPLPLPGDRVPGVPGNADNPFGDLSDILRRGRGLPGGGGGDVRIPFPMPGGGGRRGTEGGGSGGGGDVITLPGGSIDGGMLGKIIREMLGGSLGYKGGGLTSWLLRLIFMKFGWGILRRLLGFGR